MSQSKKEMMNRALSAMTINIGKAGVNDNVIEEMLVLMIMLLKKSNANLKLMKLLNLNLQKISLEIKTITSTKLSQKLERSSLMLGDMLL